MRALDVFVSGARVGSLERLDEYEHRFQFDDDWLSDPTHPVLGQIFEDRKPNAIETTGQMPLWFEHLLPPLKSPLRRALERQVGLEANDEQGGFELLSAMGSDLPGAVTMVPGQPSLRSARKPLEDGPKPRAGELRMAFSGQQWKLSVREGERGLVVPVEGKSGSWMAKFHDPRHAELPRVELATMTWASHSGLEVPRIRLGHVDEFERLPEGTPKGDGTVFLIERFDRQANGERVHIEDFAQIFDTPKRFDQPFEHLAVLVARLCPERELQTLCERFVFCVLCGNADGHLQNWSLLYPDGRNAVLSPVYDVIATVVYPEIDDFLALTLRGSAHYQEVSAQSFEGVARATGYAFDEVRGWVEGAAQRGRDVWAARSAELPFTQSDRARIEQHLKRVPLGR